jgi:hypothetical protein
MKRKDRLKGLELPRECRARVDGDVVEHILPCSGKAWWGDHMADEAMPTIGNFTLITRSSDQSEES